MLPMPKIIYKIIHVCAYVHFLSKESGTVHHIFLGAVNQNRLRTTALAKICTPSNSSGISLLSQPPPRRVHRIYTTFLY